ncbi:hypothetical protein FH972_024538 [Carpinus fangiana]|uniref:Elongator complex protein 2 n=1 Tax=Carpinus fangiana TaxID=176857 RepID=A0A5N6L0U2_9ROSI|nr:hypothetical protein FH972_024538 [Carpinus fangiana]
MPKAASAYLAAGGNRHPSAAAWDPDSGYLAYGADCNVALWRPIADSQEQASGSNSVKDQCDGVEYLLSGHKEQVNAIYFCNLSEDLSVLVTGSANGELHVWRHQDFSTPATVLDLHKKSINCIASFQSSNIFVSASADFTLGIWHISKSDNGSGFEVKLVQQIKLTPSFIPLTISLTSFPNTDSLVLAVAGTRSFIQLFTSSNRDIGFSLASTLTGHEGWIRSLSFTRETDDPFGDLLLASASQDKYIRLWRFHCGQSDPSTQKSDPLLGGVGNLTLSNKTHRFSVANGASYSITFEALLLGHEDWIYTAQWNRSNGVNRLLSASADNSLAIWELDVVSGVWVCTVRLGEISAQKGATTATGSAGGFWIGLWSQDGSAVISLGRTGSWRLWSHSDSDDTWTQQIAVTGHTRTVQGLTWARDGSYLLTTSADQTTRMFAQWQHSQETGRRSWHEFSRAQIHGYDLNCVASTTPTQFVSGADEKLLRVFDQPKAVAEMLQNLSGLQSNTSSDRPEVASIPVLGLSNKAIEQTAENGEPAGADDESPSVQIDRFYGSSTPPTEDILARHLLWPEIEKLYGHGHEISCVASSQSGQIIATACRASSIDHAVIRLYNTNTWRELKPVLTAHTLTVTALAFSPDDSYLLSVGRDRSFSIFARGDGLEDGAYSLKQKNEKAHSRMVLDCAWLPAEVGPAFATSARDKTIRIWRVLEDAHAEPVTSIAAPGPVNAVAVQGLRLINGAVWLAYGIEDGSVSLVQLDAETLHPRGEIYLLPSALHPSKAVAKMEWRPLSDSAEEQLAIAGEDSSLRIVAVHSDGVP